MATWFSASDSGNRLFVVHEAWVGVGRLLASRNLDPLRDAADLDKHGTDLPLALWSPDRARFRPEEWECVWGRTMQRQVPDRDARRARSFYEARGADFDPTFIGPLWHVLGLAQILTTDIDRIVRPTGLSAADLVLLGTIRIAAPDILRSTDLAAKLHVSGAALSARIARLEGLGLVRRHGQSRDRRALDLTLTEAGEALSDQATSAVAREAAFARRFRQLPVEEQEALTAVLGKLHGLVDRDFLPTSR